MTMHFSSLLSLTRLRAMRPHRPHWRIGDGGSHPPRKTDHPWKKRTFPVRTETNETK